MCCEGQIAKVFNKMGKSVTIYLLSGILCERKWRRYLKERRFPKSVSLAILSDTFPYLSSASDFLHEKAKAEIHHIQHGQDIINTMCSQF